MSKTSPPPLNKGKDKDAPRVPWYRHRFVWLIVAGPSVVVVASLYTGWLAYRNQDPMVDENYYSAGLGVNKTLHAAALAEREGIVGKLTVSPTSGDVTLVLTQNPGTPMPPPTLAMQLHHPSAGNLDQSLILAQVGQGSYTAHMSRLEPASWSVVVEDMEHTWRISGWWDPRDNAPVTLTAKFTAASPKGGITR